MTCPAHVAIIAAGQGKRMHSALPKVLHPLAGRPLVAHVLAAARALAPRAIVLVVGHGGDAVEQATGRRPTSLFVRQDPPRGTGDAVRVRARRAAARRRHAGGQRRLSARFPPATFAALVGSCGTAGWRC